MDDAVFQGLTEKSPEGMFGYNVPAILIDHAMRNPHIRPASGAASTPTTTRSTANALSTSWPTRPGRTRSNSAARC